MRPYEVVFDTNVFVSGARSRLGASYALISMIGGRKFKLNISVALAFEYEAALKRDEGFSGLSDRDIEDIVDYICAVSRHQKISYLWRPCLADPNDDFILELAVAAQCDAIVTHNMKHFVQAGRFGVDVLRPQDFLRKLGGVK